MLRTAFSGGRHASSFFDGCGSRGTRRVGGARIKPRGSVEMRDVRKLVLVELPVVEASRWSRAWWGMLERIQDE
jgi:hypothetical protein